jgi:hypothetical protein
MPKRTASHQCQLQSLSKQRRHKTRHKGLTKAQQLSSSCSRRRQSGRAWGCASERRLVVSLPAFLFGMTFSSVCECD